MEKLLNLLSPHRLIFKIILVFCFVFICANIIMSVFFYESSSNIIKRNNKSFTDSYAKSVSDSIDDYVLEIDRVAKIILGNAQIQDILDRMNQPNYTSFQMITDLQTIQNTIWSFTSVRDGATIALADKDGNLINPTTIYFDSYNLNMFDDKYIKENTKALDNGDFLLVPPYRTNFTFYGGKPAYILIRSLNDLETNDTLAYIMVIFNTDTLYANLMQYAPKGVNIEILDKSGYVAMSPDRDLIGKKAPRIVSSERTALYRSGVTGFTAYISIPGSYLESPFKTVFAFLFPLTVIVILGSFVIAVFMVSNVLRPIEHLITAMKKVDEGSLNISLKEKPNSIEVETLFNNFNHMFVEIRNLTQSVIDETLLYKNAQMAALQYQINPHFFYNTLQTMEAIGEVNGVPEIQVMAKSLGDLFRYNIRGSNVVSLSQELEQMETYLKIEKIRFKNRLEYNITSSKEAGECRILKFVLQPIVENCFVHGMKGKKREGLVSIDARIEESVLVIEVFNSGIPIGAERLAHLREKLGKISEVDGNLNIFGSIGLMNVHSRIVNSFGSRYGVDIVYSDDRGTCVRLLIPAEMGGLENV